jgi:hypothetical protein
MICCYHLFTFTEFVDDPEKRYQIGYSLIAFTALNISVNIFMMIVLTLMKIVKLIQ